MMKHADCNRLCRSVAERSYLSPKSGAAADRSYPTSKVRGSGREEHPHVKEAVAGQAQEGREELLHVQGQEGQPMRRYPSFLRLGLY